MLFMNFSGEHVDAFKSKYRDVAEQYKGKGINFLMGDMESSQGAFEVSISWSSDSCSLDTRH